jgi:hypothetical protein
MRHAHARFGPERVRGLLPRITASLGSKRAPARTVGIAARIHCDCRTPLGGRCEAAPPELASRRSGRAIATTAARRRSSALRPEGSREGWCRRIRRIGGVRCRSVHCHRTGPRSTPRSLHRRAGRGRRAHRTPFPHTGTSRRTARRSAGKSPSSRADGRSRGRCRCTRRRERTPFRPTCSRRTNRRVPRPRRPSARTRGSRTTHRSRCPPRSSRSASPSTPGRTLRRPARATASSSTRRPGTSSLLPARPRT